ncbi:MAG: CBS domain-containing protein [Rhodothermales bacterium]
MIIEELMTPNPECCTPETKLHDVSRIMAECDCGAVPVVEDLNAKKPLGMITDRDITVRLVALGVNPLEKTAADAMTKSTITARPEMDIKEAARLMKENQVRRLIVQNVEGSCVGILAQADLALDVEDRRTGDVVQSISEPSRTHAMA